MPLNLAGCRFVASFRSLAVSTFNLLFLHLLPLLLPPVSYRSTPFPLLPFTPLLQDHLPVAIYVP
ncbi:hypothetical protein IE53DRAFT_88361 [Violaceomyces palustris]|uniref:Uncharacterized protein n=1 Tax=Violaceomyces palustris TaxID=1673888 RepID=A0ACD0NXU7_9BASI|nr:hypothetical protein IE53DRAFT_88361 [Violaceomyces palustris]